MADEAEKKERKVVWSPGTGLPSNNHRRFPGMNYAGLRNQINQIMTLEGAGKTSDMLSLLNNYEPGTTFKDVPAVALEDERHAFQLLHWRLDPKIQEVEERLIEDNAHNRHWCFEVDNICQMVAYSVTRLLISDGVKVKIDDEKAQEYFDEWSKNVRKTPSVYSLNAMLRDVVVDNLTHGEALFTRRKVDLDTRGYMFVKGYGNKAEGKDKAKTQALAMHRIDQRTVRTLEHDFLGLKKWLQYALVPVEMDEKGSEELFYDEDYIPGGFAMVDSDLPLPRAKIHRTQITDRQAVHFNLFVHPPIRTAMQEIAYKRWIIWTMRIAAERTAIPIRYATIGNEHEHPADEDYPDVLQEAVELLQASRSGDVYAFPHYWQFGTVSVDTNVMDFVTQLNWLNEQIALSLGSHMALYQASGSDLATSTVIEDMLIRAVIGMRKEIAIVLEELFTDALRVAGFKVDVEKGSKYKIQIMWPPLKADAYADFVGVVTSLCTTTVNGKPIIQNRNEARKLLSPFLELEEIPDDDDDEDLFRVAPGAESDKPFEAPGGVKGADKAPGMQTPQNQQVVPMPSVPKAKGTPKTSTNNPGAKSIQQRTAKPKEPGGRR